MSDYWLLNRGTYTPPPHGGVEKPGRVIFSQHLERGKLCFCRQRCIRQEHSSRQRERDGVRECTASGTLLFDFELAPARCGLRMDGAEVPAASGIRALFRNRALVSAPSPSPPPLGLRPPR